MSDIPPTSDTQRLALPPLRGHARAVDDDEPGELEVEEPSTLRAQRDQAHQQIQEQQQVINALRATTVRYRAQLEEILRGCYDVDDASEQRVEQLAALYLALDEAEARVVSAEVRATRAEVLLETAMRELTRLTARRPAAEA